MTEFVILWAIATTILWLVIGWRAMRAHEDISHTLRRYVASQEVDKSAEIRAEMGKFNRDYKKFINEDPGRADLTPKERHEAFRKWNEERDT